ncbi:uncharacterized protein LOC115046608 [Echeneis naucrates]|uniref:uncharacterized protein LOC115046608 n=1 Tax=Echeneis naucrates TaxID=173247 RepID=UPI0011136864|nr:uncharacterized protein LOC115046608 [Echeneis naucrates]
MCTMKNYTVFLICSLSCISASDFNTRQVKLGEEVTLLCTNFTSTPSQVTWFRVAKLTGLQRISHMFCSSESASYYDGFQNGRFNVVSNMSTIFLQIKQMTASDSGMYFCGYPVSKKPLIISLTYLEVEERLGETMKWSMLLGALSVFLIVVIIGLVIKIKKLQKAQTEELKSQQRESQTSELNYTAVTFQPRRSENPDLY